jgi:hypothetical protein
LSTAILRGGDDKIPNPPFWCQAPKREDLIKNENDYTTIMHNRNINRNILMTR